MPKKLEYRILPQGEKDEFHSHVRTTTSNGRITTQYFCVFTLTLGIIVLILAGVATLTASMFYSEKITTTLGRFWFDYSVESTKAYETTPTPLGDDSFNQHDTDSSRSYNDSGIKTTTVGQNRNKTDYKITTHRESNNLQHHHYTLTHKNISHDSNFNSSNNSDNDLPTFFNSSLSDEKENEMEASDSKPATIDVEDLKKRFEEAVRDFEKQLEHATGIKKAEFLVPIFMLISFLLIFSLTSLCCYVLMRRKDNRRRKLFGKLITDLQTGDSKTVLLNNMDLDD